MSVTFAGQPMPNSAGFEPAKTPAGGVLPAFRWAAGFISRAGCGNHCLTARIALVVASACFPLAALNAAEKNAAAEARLADAVRYLASDDLEGRGVGDKGIDLAADYLAEQFKALGLQTELFEGAPFQRFKISTGARLGEENQLALVGPDGKKIELQMGRDFNPLVMGGSGEFDLPIVFVGYGITAPDEGYDDYAGLDVKGKAVLVLRHEPQQDNPHSKFEGTKNSQYAPLNRKLANASEHGAAAAIFVSTEHGVLKDLGRAQRGLEQAIDALAKAKEKFAENKGPTLEQVREFERKVELLTADVTKARERLVKSTDEILKPTSGSNEDANREFPVAHIQRAAIERAIENALDTTLAKLEEQIDDGPTPRSRELTGWQLQGKFTVHRQQADARNVVAVLAGEGPLADETIVIGAHYDHLGHGGSGSLAPGVNEIHNGADDNASGAAALVEVARILAARPEKLPRRIVFVAFTGEERGLLGSAHYVAHPLFPLDKTIAMLNMDMVGRLRDDKLIVYGTGTSDELDKAVEDANEKYGFKIAKQPSGFGPSDQTSFYAKKVPVLHFFTGIHSDYHRPSDDSDKINVDGMFRIAELVADVATAVAQDDARPVYKSTGASREMGSGGDRPYFGSIPEFGREEPGYALSGVTKDSPAEKGGLKGGDVIIQLGESQIANLEDFDSALRKHKAGDKVPVVVRRDGAEVKVEVTLEPPK